MGRGSLLENPTLEGQTPGGEPPQRPEPPRGESCPQTPRTPNKGENSTEEINKKRGGPPEKGENIKEFANSSNNPVKTGAFAQKTFFRRKLEHLALLKGFEDQA